MFSQMSNKTISHLSSLELKVVQVGTSAVAEYLGLVGDTADRFPGLQGWGAKSASTVLAKIGAIANIPDNNE